MRVVCYSGVCVAVTVTVVCCVFALLSPLVHCLWPQFYEQKHALAQQLAEAAQTNKASGGGYLNLPFNIMATIGGLAAGAASTGGKLSTAMTDALLHSIPEPRVFSRARIRIRILYLASMILNLVWGGSLPSMLTAGQLYCGLFGSF